MRVEKTCFCASHLLMHESARWRERERESKILNKKLKNEMREGMPRKIRVKETACKEDERP